jgi:hypothetical protein
MGCVTRRNIKIICFGKQTAYLAPEHWGRGDVALSGRALFLSWLRRPILDAHWACDRRRLCSPRPRRRPLELIFQSFDSCAGSLILSDATRNLAMRHRPNELAELAMKSVTIAAIVLACAISAGEVANAQSAPPGQLQPCMARVVYSEELPFAPIDSWLVKVTLQVIPRSGAAYFTTLQERMPWQGPPPRRGQAYRVWCDPANPNHLQLASGAVGKSAF